MHEEQVKEAIRDGEAAWVQASSGTWDTSSWWRMGAALILIRAQVLHQLGINVARGGKYNDAFSKRIADTKFATMEPVTRSNLLFLMEPENRIVLDLLLLSWKPDVRARRTHPITLAKYVKAEQKPKPQPKPAPQPAAKPASSPQAEPVMTLDMISSKSGREQAEIFMRQFAKRTEAEIKYRVHVENQEWLKRLLEDYRTKEKHYDIISGRWKGLLKKADYNKLRFAVHPDTYKSVSTDDRNRAAQLLEELKPVLLKAEDAPTKLSDLPTVEEMLRNREKVRQANSERSKAAHARAKTRREAV
jgi:hypothetical protein